MNRDSNAPAKRKRRASQPAVAGPPAEPLRVFVTTPVYKIVRMPVPPVWRAEASIQRQGAWGAGPISVRWALRDESSGLRARAQVRVPAGRSKASLMLRPDALQPGAYRSIFSLLDSNGRRIAGREVQLRLVDRPLRVWIDAQRGLHAGGAPFFPLGLYMAGHDADQDLERIAAAGFNTVLSYTWGFFGHSAAQGMGPGPRSFLDRASGHGLRVVYSVKDAYEAAPFWPCRQAGACVPDTTGADLVREYVVALRDHPALLGWYLNDELPPAFVPQLRERLALLGDLDPDHPALQVLSLDPAATRVQQALALDAYYDSTDILGVDPYPVAAGPPLSRPLKMVAGWTESAQLSARNARPVWTVIQTHPLGNYTGNPADRAPTLEEQRCMALLALIHRANGLLFYSHFDLFHAPGKPEDPSYFEARWAEVSRLGAEIRSLVPALLRGTEVALPSGDPPSPLQVRTLEHDGRLFVLLSNPNPTTSARRNFTLPSGGQAQPQVVSGSVQVRRQGRNLQVDVPAASGGALSLDMR
jgi:hypothetical protein